MESYEFYYRSVPFRYTNSIDYSHMIEIPETYDSYTRGINFIKRDSRYYEKCLTIVSFGLKERLPKEIIKMIIFFWLDSENSERTFETTEHVSYNEVSELYDFDLSFDDIE